jgi:hypothetical protein
VTVSPDFAAVMALVLTAVDPAATEQEREDAWVEAFDTCPESTASAAIGYLRVVLSSLSAQFGPGSTAHVMHQLTQQSMGMIDPTGGGDD